MTSRTSRRKLTLGLLQALVREEDDPVSFLEQGGLAGLPLPSDAEARIRYLAGRLGLRETDPDDLGAVWTRALAKGTRPTRRELLDLARDSAAEALPADDTVEKWRRALRLRLDPILRRREAQERETGLDLYPLLEDWPRRLLEDREWSCVESPLPEMEPLPLAEVWVDLTLLEPRDTFDLQKAETLRKTLDLYYGERRWRATPLEAFVDRLASPAVLIGPPGSGKTTALKWIARHLVLNAEGRYLLPLFVPLRSFGHWKRAHPEGRLLHYALNRAGVRDPRQVEQWTGVLTELGGPSEEDVLLLLDGWDEVREEDREALREDIESHLQIFSILLTSRPSGYPRNLPFYEFHEILELSPESADTLVQRWFERAGAPDRAEILRFHLDQRHDLRRMARNPFLLTLLCGLCLRAGHRRQDLPASRSELYREALQLIYAHHNQRYPSDLLDGARQRQTERLALWLFDEAPEAPRYVFGREDVLACSDEPELLDRYLKPARLLSQWSLAEDSYHFLHTTFHEYLAARALTQEPDQSALARLRRHVADARWQEVFLFTAGQPDAIRHLFWQEMARQAAHPDRFGHVFLRLARLVSEAGLPEGGREKLGVDVREPLWKGIVSFTTNEPFIDAYALVDGAGLAERAGQALPNADKTIRVRLLQAVARARTAETSSVLVEQILTGDEHTAGAALKQLHIYGRVDGADLTRLRAAASSRKTRVEIRRRAISALGSLRDFVSIPRLVEIARQKRSLAEEVVEALGWIGGAEATKSLGHMFSWYEDLSWQMEITLELGDIQHPLARDFLLDMLASREAYEDLTIAILSALAEKPIHRGIEMILKALYSLDHPLERSMAAKALTHARGPGVREALVEAARRDPEEPVRTEALEALEKHAVPSDVYWLADRVRDPSLNPYERSRALQTLLLTAQRYAGTAHEPDMLRAAAMEVLAVLQVPSGEVALTAAMLGYLAGKAVAPRFVEVCSDPSADWEVRKWCCLSLGQLRFRPAVPVLLSLVRESPDIEDDEEIPRYQIGQKLAQEAAWSLTRIDPGVLLAERGTASAFALARFALETGSLVFSDLILGSDGRETARVSPSALAAVRTETLAQVRPAPPGLLTPDLQIFIRVPAETAEITFELQARDPALRLDGERFGPVRLLLPPREYARTLIKDIEALSSHDEESRTIAQTRLGTKGANLFKALIPEALQHRLWDLQGRVSTVQILSDEPHIPWEVLKLLRKGTRRWEKGPFLGEAFAVTRWLRGIPECHHFPLRQLALVAPQAPDLPDASAERRDILALRGRGRKVKQIQARYSPLLRALGSGNYDGWHFTGHGSAQGEDPDRWELWLEDQQFLRPEDLSEAERLGELRPWVFLNACYAGRSGISLAGMGGWAKQFLDAGAGAFVGPHWAVSDHWAREFARALYQRLLSGIPLGEAVHAARLEIRDAAPGDPSWLAYSVFGHPLATCGASTTLNNLTVTV
jgi:DNA polymerase III delta prime subunit